MKKRKNISSLGLVPEIQELDKYVFFKANKRIAFRKGGCIQVFKYGDTTNAKIADAKHKIVQSYTFSNEQFNYVTSNKINGIKNDMNEFFKLDKANCEDCVFSANVNGRMGKCYTHKRDQYSGFISMLKSIGDEFTNDIQNIDFYGKKHEEAILKISFNKYIRFGTYGEPSQHPFELVEMLVKISSNHTGYTHQFKKRKEFAPYFMASVHNDTQALEAKDEYQYRSFISYDGKLVTESVQCPASAEMGYKSKCSICSLCSGIEGKGKKDVRILVH